MAEYVKMGEYKYMSDSTEYFQNYTQYSLLMPCKKNELLAPLPATPSRKSHMEDTDTGFLQFGMCDQISKACNVGNMDFRIAVNATAATIPMTFQMYMRMGFMRVPRRTMFSCMPKTNTIVSRGSAAESVDGTSARPSAHTHRPPTHTRTDHEDTHMGFGGALKGPGGAQGNNPAGTDNSSSFAQLGPSGDDSWTPPLKGPSGPVNTRSAVLGELEELSYASQSVHNDKADTDDKSEGDASQTASSSRKKPRNRLKSIAIPDWAKDSAEPPGQVAPSVTDTV